jgi:DinB superfamily
MPTAAATDIAATAYGYKRNAVLLGKAIVGLTPEDWLRRPCPTSNPVLWIVGHIIWGRSRALSFLGQEWTRPWLPLFARGAELIDDAQLPSQEEIVSSWEDISATLDAALESAPAEKLSAPAPERSPSLDGTIGGMVAFLTFHETYHVGQVGYLRCWLGHEGAVG